MIWIWVKFKALEVDSSLPMGYINRRIGIMKKYYKIIQLIFTLALIGGLVFYFEDDLRLAKDYLIKAIDPCGQPLVYSIGGFDERFGLSQADFSRTIDEAAKIWQDPVNKKLFSLRPDGPLKINLIYDSRQAATDKLKTLGISIHNNRASYEILKDKYEALEKVYQTQKNELDNMVKYYEEQAASYKAEVSAANKRGGVNAEEHALLEQERKDLDKLVESIKAKKAAFNKTVEDLNAMASVINRLINGLNLTVKSYNTVGASSSGEFQAGQYVRDVSGERIDIYQFDDRAALIRVLAHELGHALGIEHLDNPQAIMYRLNESGNDKITADDIMALKKTCKLK